MHPPPWIFGENRKTDGGTGRSLSMPEGEPERAVSDSHFRRFLLFHTTKVQASRVGLRSRPSIAKR